MDNCWKKTLWMTQKTLGRTVEKELEQLHFSCGQGAKQAADRTKWRILDSALCASGHEEDSVIIYK